MQNLQDINYQKFIPKPPLDNYVQAIWLAYNPSNFKELPFKILSDCGASVIYNFSQSLTLSRSADSKNVDQHGAIIGPSKDLLQMTFRGPVKALGIHFFASGGHLFFSKTMDNLTSGFFDNASSIFPSGAALTQQLENFSKSDNPKDFVSLVEEHLLKELSQYEGQAQKRLSQVMQLVQVNPNFSLQELADYLQISIREVQRIFKQYVGVTPKTFLRVNKINQLKERIANNEFSTFTDLAIECGYFDQAHFIRDFKLFMQKTPKQYHKLKQSK